MDLLFDIIFELLGAGAEEIIENKKISKWIRYPVIFLVSLVWLLIVGGLLVLGIVLINKSNIGAAVCILLGIFLLIISIIKFKNEYLKRKK